MRLNVCVLNVLCTYEMEFNKCLRVNSQTQALPNLYILHTQNIEIELCELNNGTCVREYRE